MMMRVLIHAASWVVVISGAATANGQFPPNEFDEDRYLRGLEELGLPEVLEHYDHLHPPADDVERVQRAILLKRIALRQHELSGAQRETMVLDLLAQRDALLAAHPNDHRRAQWLADQAADVYYELLTIEASGLTALLGMPSPQQRQRAEQAAARMLLLARTAEQAIEQVLLELEAVEGFSDDIQLQLQRRRLVEQLRDRQIPFLHGIALYLDAAINVRDRETMRSQLEQAVNLLSPLSTDLHAPHNHRAKLYLGLALAQLGRLEEAHTALSQVTFAQPADRLLVFSAELATAMNASNGSRELQRMAERYRTPNELFFRLLVADALFRTNRSRSLQEAFRAYTAILEEDHHIDVDQLRDIVFDRLTRVVLPSMPAQSLPPIAILAQASQLLREPQTRDEAVRLLTEQIHSDQVTGSDRALALLLLGRAYHAAGDLTNAAEHYLMLAQQHPRSPDAERAVELGVSLATSAYSESPDAVRPLLSDGLALLLERYANLPTIDRWRFLAGQIALHERHFDRALEHFRSVRPRSARGADAAFMQAQTLHRAAVAATGSRSAELHHMVLDTAAESRDALLRAMSESQGARREELRHYLATLSIIAAKSHLQLGETAQSLQSVETISSDAQLPGTIVAEAMQVRIEAYQALGEVEQAQREVDQFINTAPQRVAQVLAPLMRSIEREVIALLNEHQQERSLQLAQRELAPLAQRLEVWLDTSSHGEPQRATLLPLIADAYRLSGHYARANRLYDELLVDQPTQAKLLFGKAECLYATASGDDASQQLGQAMLLYRRLTTAGPGIGTSVYWQSHLRSLQILDQTGRNTQQILPQIQRLRLRDREMGGERYRRGFDALQNKYAAGSSGAD